MTLDRTTVLHLRNEAKKQAKKLKRFGYRYADVEPLEAAKIWADVALWLETML